MEEKELLNRTLKILEKDGLEEAYKFITENHQQVETDNKSQIYNFLYCLAASTNHKEEALAWLEEAILINQYWYRPQVFEDSDLESLFGEERFEKCKIVSEERYDRKRKSVETEYTWKRQDAKNILLALHGNQEIINSGEHYWNKIRKFGYQVEYMQSCELDSFELYRWEENGSGSSQISEVCNIMNWSSYSNRILGGFSAGCNVIIQALIERKVECEFIILQSPWIPCIEAMSEEFLSLIQEKRIKVLLICGTEDLDCMPLTIKLRESAVDREISIKVILIEGLDHEFSEHFQDIVGEFLDS